MLAVIWSPTATSQPTADALTHAAYFFFWTVGC
jgi:hypothetical protein